jgi:hypothetical protein
MGQMILALVGVRSRGGPGDEWGSDDRRCIEMPNRILESKRLLWGMVTVLATVLAVAAASDPSLGPLAGVAVFIVVMGFTLVLVWANS